MAIFQQVPRAAAAADEAVALARNIAGKDAAAAAGARGASLLAKGFQTEIQSLEEMLKHSSALRDPANAAKVWDKTYQEIAQNAKFKGMPIGPNGKTITYQMPDGSMKVLSITEKPPLGAQRISMTDDELRAMMPPRPTPPAEATPRPANAYNEPRPAGMEPPTSPPPAAGAAPSATAETVERAKDVAGGARSPRGPWEKPQSGVPNVPRPAAPAPFVAAEPSNLAVYGAPAAIGAGAVAAGASALEGAATDRPSTFGNILKSYGYWPDPTLTPREDNPNLDRFGYMGPGVSASPDDFRSDNLPIPADEGSPFMGSPLRPEEGSTFVGSPLRSDYNSPYVGSPGSTVQRALTASRAAAPTVASGTGQTASPEAASPSMLAQIIRGRFGEAAKEDPNKLTAYQLARDEQDRTRQGGMASGGSVEPKPPKDAALHKALEIIHHLIRRG